MDAIHVLRDLLRLREWTDFAELLLIGGAVYVVLRFLRGTRGEGLLRGVLLLLAAGTLLVNLVANVFDLERIKVLYPLFLGGLFLVSLVAFQPELRRALGRLGAIRWFGGPSSEVEQLVGRVVDAATDLSENKFGAIIVFQRVTELGALIDSGCRLDAEVSRELLNTIFWPGTALHDMAVIVAHGRVAAAAVPLPLADAEGLDPSLGTRHRAALGVSQDTDAIVVVISEETGKIGVAVNGQLTRGLSSEDLRDFLRNHLDSKAVSKRNVARRPSAEGPAAPSARPEALGDA
jgi:diadenylate cyclase